MLILAIEKWAPVPGFPGYEVSDMGGIRSLMRSKHWRALKGETDKDGYTRVALYRDGKQTKFPLHRLVALCFVSGRTAERDIACHRNGNKANNAAGNLKWATQAENIADKLVHGTHQIGSKHPRATVSEATVVEIKRLISTLPQRKGKLIAIAESLGISKHVVYKVKAGAAWGHV